MLLPKNDGDRDLALKVISDRTKQNDTMAGILGALLTTSSSKRETEHLDRLQSAVVARIEQLSKTYGVTTTRDGRSLLDFVHAVENVKANPHNLTALFSDLDFLKLVKHSPRAALELGNAEGRLGVPGGGYIEVLASKARLLFKSPFSLRVQSWARPYVFDHPDHLGVPTKNKSVFIGSRADRIAWIHKAFEDSIGIIDDPDRLFLYARFREQIGLLKNDGGPSSILCVQCDREKASTDGHYKTKLHGYPYSQAELDADLAKVPELRDLLN
jgi:hypothetical protein